MGADASVGVDSKYIDAKAILAGGKIFDTSLASDAFSMDGGILSVGLAFKAKLLKQLGLTGAMYYIKQSAGKAVSADGQLSTPDKTAIVAQGTLSANFNVKDKADILLDAGCRYMLKTNKRYEPNKASEVTCGASAAARLLDKQLIIGGYGLYTSGKMDVNWHQSPSGGWIVGPGTSWIDLKGLTAGGFLTWHIKKIVALTLGYEYSKLADKPLHNVYVGFAWPFEATEPIGVK